MAIITLTTDFGNRDHFAAVVKGAIYSELPTACIVDITHEISPFHIMEAAYIVQNAYKQFPKGSVHIIGIDSEIHLGKQHLAIALDDHYFICADNGIMSLLTTTLKPEKIVAININDGVPTNFPTLDVFVKVACHIARGGQLAVIGSEISEIKTITGITPITNLNGQQIVGSVIHIDNYGNLVTNITKELFQKVGQGRSFVITARTATFQNIFSRYSEAINFTIEKSKREEDGKKLAIFNASGYLELAIYKSNPKTVGGASSLFGLNYRDTVSIKFDN